MSSSDLPPQHDFSVWYQEIRETASRKSVKSAASPRTISTFADSTESSRAKRKNLQVERQKPKGGSDDYFSSRRPAVNPSRVSWAPDMRRETLENHEKSSSNHRLGGQSRSKHQHDEKRYSTPSITVTTPRHQTKSADAVVKLHKSTSDFPGSIILKHASNVTSQLDPEIISETSSLDIAKQRATTLQDMEHAKQMNRISISYEPPCRNTREARRYSSFFRPRSSISSNDSISEHTALVTLVNNASKSMSLRKYLLWVTLQDVHRFQSVHHPQAYNIAFVAEPTIIVLRNLQVLEAMYRPGRVWLPSDDARNMVETIHGTLLDLKLEMEDRYHDIIENQRVMSAGQFVDWATHEYRIGNRKLELSHGLFRYNPDSIQRQQDAVVKAMSYYQSPSLLHESSATNIFAEVLVRVLATYLVNRYRRPVGKFLKNLLHGKDERDRVEMDRRLPMLDNEDILVWQHPAPF